MGTGKLLLTLVIFGIAAMLMFSILPAMAAPPEGKGPPFRVSDTCSSGDDKCKVFFDRADDGCEEGDRFIMWPAHRALTLKPCGNGF